MTRLIQRFIIAQQTATLRFCFAFVWLSLSALTACSLSGPPIPGQVDTGNHHERRVYAGIAGAATRLQPITEGSAYELDETSSAGAAVTLGMDVSTRFALELTAADLGSVSLAPIATAGPGVAPQQITYSTVAGSLLYYVVGDHLRANRRKGLAGYARVGMSQTDSSADIQIDQQDAVQLFVGLGTEYMMGRSAGVRAELVGYDGDATAAQLGLVYRFGGATPAMRGPIVERSADPVPQPSPEPALEPTLEQTAEQTAQHSTQKVPATTPSDLPTPDLEEREEVVAGTEQNAELPELPEQSSSEATLSGDESTMVASKPEVELIEPTAKPETELNTEQALVRESANNEEKVALVKPPVKNVTPAADKVAAPVNEVTAQVNEVTTEANNESTLEVTPEQPIAVLGLEGVLGGVEFVRGTATLTPTAKSVLVRYAAALKESSGARVEIRTHTDDTGDSRAAMTLTRQRAVSIARLLIGAGVNKQQLAARAFGSNVPRADNQTEGGRRMNNRVEFKKL